MGMLVLSRRSYLDVLCEDTFSHVLAYSSEVLHFALHAFESEIGPSLAAHTCYIRNITSALFSLKENSNPVM